VQRLRVELGERSYPILIGPGLLGRADLFAEHVVRSGSARPTRDFLLVTNTTVGPLYAAKLRATLAAAAPGVRVVEAVVPDGEHHKTLTNIAGLFDVLVTNRYARDACVLALGGGVVGDMAGFAAACYQRGIDFVQLPTTVLAQVDSSVGGKTGVNHPGGKNLIGAFHQPRAVIADTDTLATLPPRELRAGVAEIIKCALICDEPFFGWLESHIEALLALEPEPLAHAIRRSCEIKAAIVARDERESGDRALLNLGHTFGHAIEAVQQYRGLLHGEAVGAGLAMAATFSAHAGLMAHADVARVHQLLRRAGLPVVATDVAGSAALDAMRIDKKVQSGRMRFVLLRGIGASFVTSDYPEAALAATLAAHFG
jgi:3-dehydroquinate synthase